jgi:hypothetical protein
VRGASYQSIQIHKPDTCGLAPFDVTSLLLADIHASKYIFFLRCVLGLVMYASTLSILKRRCHWLAPSRRSCLSTYNSIDVTLEKLDHGVFELLGIVPITSASMPWANSAQPEREQSLQKLDASITNRKISRTHRKHLKNCGRPLSSQMSPRAASSRHMPSLLICAAPIREVLMSTAVVTFYSSVKFDHLDSIQADILLRS